MNLSLEEQILIVKQIAEICALVPECGVILPSPIIFIDKADFQKNVGNSSLNKQKEIETSEIAFTIITFSKLPKKPEKHGGYWTYYFNLYIFREYDAERLDETETPDDFRQRLLKSYTDFVGAILGIHTQIGEEVPLDVNSANFRDCILKQQNTDEVIEDYDKCRFIPGVVGYSVDYPLEVKVLFGEC
jgi:hypothetical protein